MKTATQLFKTAKLEMILAISLGAIFWLMDALVNGPWWLLVGFLVWTLTRAFDKIVGWPKLHTDKLPKGHLNDKQKSDFRAPESASGQG